MLKSILVLPDGRELSSGAEALQPLMQIKLTESVNNYEELTMGAVFANVLEIRINTYQKPLDLTAGDQVVLYKENDAGVRCRIGSYILDKPTRPAADTMELRGFDRVIRLNRDLTDWIKGLTGWPYRLIDFAGMVCHACGLEFVTDTVPNGDFLVQPFACNATGYQLMRWIGEVCCRFCRATADGKIELAWYTPAGVSITPSGDSYYLQNSLSYEAYEVAPIDAVQIRLADNESGALWPDAEESANRYIIEWNPILLSRVTEELRPVLNTIKEQLPAESYRPFKVSVPATLDIHAGNTVQITDKNGMTFTSLVMSKEQAGQMDTLECTGSYRRDGANAQCEMTEQERLASLKHYADNAASSAKAYTDAENEKLNQLELLKRLTKEWTDVGIYLDGEGRLAINASAILTGVLAASLVKTGILQSADGKTWFNLDSGQIVTESENGNVTKLTEGNIRLYDKDGILRLRIEQLWDEILNSFGMYLYGDVGELVGGFDSLYGNFWIYAKDFDEGSVKGRKVAWKQINGIKTLVAYEEEEPVSQNVVTLYSGTLDSGSVSFDGAYSQYVIVGYTTQNQCKVSLSIPAPSCDGSLFQLYADEQWVSFNMSENTLMISKVSNGGAITGIYGIV